MGFKICLFRDISGNWWFYDDTIIRNGGVNLSDKYLVSFSLTRDGSGDNNLWLDELLNLIGQTNNQSLGTIDLVFGATNSKTGYIYNYSGDTVNLPSGSTS